MCSAACLFRFSFGSLSLNNDSGSFTPLTGSWAYDGTPTDKSASVNKSLRIVIIEGILMHAMNGASLLVAALENEGVERIFGVPGEENLDLLEALLHSSIELVVMRHEQT